MKRKIISLILSVMFLFSMNVQTVFADDIQDPVPYDSQLVVDLVPERWNNIYTGNLPILLGQDLDVSNYIDNIGSIEVRITYTSSEVIASEQTIEPGQKVTFDLPGTLELNDQYLVQARAVDTPGTYFVILSLGNKGEDIYPVQLLADIWSNVYFGSSPLLLDDTITIRNHIASPGAIVVQVIDEDYNLILDEIVLQPGLDVDVLIEATLFGNDYIVQARAESTPGLYFVVVED